MKLAPHQNGLLNSYNRSSIHDLDTGNNNLDGTIPKEIGKATNLTKIVLGKFGFLFYMIF